MAHHWVGTSGWTYGHWQGPFYPPGLKQRDWLGFYAGRFSSVELNASFYHLPRESFAAGWAERTPPGFLFAVKAWRAITHRHKLHDCADQMAVFFERLAGLGDKLGPVLFQLPPHWHADPPRLATFLDLLPDGGCYAFEFRDPDWHRDEVYRILAEKNAAFCLFELGDQTSPHVVTADFVYVRLHGREAAYVGDYSDSELADWAHLLREQMAEGRDVYVYFDNTDRADDALRNAATLDRMLSGAAGI
jgi:uncharacterized protein YecE (DUF72 family)